MLRILEPFAKDAQAVRADDLRNLLILSGTERELRHLMDTIDAVRRRLDARACRPGSSRCRAPT